MLRFFRVSGSNSFKHPRIYKLATNITNYIRDIRSGFVDLWRLIEPFKITVLKIGRTADIGGGHPESHNGDLSTVINPDLEKTNLK